MNTGDIITYSLSAFIIILPFLLKKKFSKDTIVNMVRSFGVFGTFLGILIGLMSFDTADIEGSVPELLNGLKTAFLTSLVGLTASIIISLFPRFYGFDGSETDELELDESLNDNEKMVLLLTEIRKTLTENSQNALVSKLDEVITQLSSSQENMLINMNKLTSTLEKGSGANTSEIGLNTETRSYTGGGSGSSLISDDGKFSEMIEQLKGLREDISKKNINDAGNPIPDSEENNKDNKQEKQKKRSEKINDGGLEQLVTEVFKIKQGLLGGTIDEDEDEILRNEPGLLTEISHNTDGINQTLSLVNNSLRKIQKSQTISTSTIGDEIEKLRLQLKKEASNNVPLLRPKQWVGVILLIAAFAAGIIYKKEIQDFISNKERDYNGILIRGKK